jgi:hypothetical protein
VLTARYAAVFTDLQFYQEPFAAERHRASGGRDIHPSQVTPIALTPIHRISAKIDTRREHPWTRGCTILLLSMNTCVSG